MSLLSIGQKGALHVRRERFSLRDDACRLLYVSDIHLRRQRSESLCRQVIEAASSCELDAVLLGGDLVDAAGELGRLAELVGALHEIAPVYAVGGNHDESVGLRLVARAVASGGGEWIHSDVACLSHGARKIVVAGPEAQRVPSGDIQVLCAHNPRVWRAAQDRGYDLVLAGHLHGCQLVAFEARGFLFPGAVFYPNCCLKRRRKGSWLVVSRGVSDLAPIRWRCPREVVLCHV